MRRDTLFVGILRISCLQCIHLEASFQNGAPTDITVAQKHQHEFEARTDFAPQKCEERRSWQSWSRFCLFLCLRTSNRLGESFHVSSLIAQVGENRIGHRQFDLRDRRQTNDYNRLALEGRGCLLRNAYDAVTLDDVPEPPQIWDAGWQA